MILVGAAQLVLMLLPEPAEVVMVVEVVFQVLVEAAAAVVLEVVVVVVVMLVARSVEIQVEAGHVVVVVVYSNLEPF